MKNKPIIYFIRHSRLDLSYASHLEMPYEVLDGLSSGRLDPGIIPNSRELFFQAAQDLPLSDIDIIYYNNSGKQSRRSLESAQLIVKIAKKQYGRDIPLVGNSDIKEIDFSLPDILSKMEFAKQGMPGVRTALYRAELAGNKVESIKEIYARIARLLTMLKKHRANNETVLLVSHDFFMRVVEVYARITTKSELVTLNDLEQTTLNNYFKGFKISNDLQAKGGH